MRSRRFVSSITNCCARIRRCPSPGGSAVIDMRRAQLKFSDHWVAEEVDGLREDWMKHADAILDDEAILTAVYEALSKRHPKSRSRGRRGAPAENGLATVDSQAYPQLELRSTRT